MTASTEATRDRPPTPAVAGRLPDFFIVGHAKCGHHRAVRDAACAIRRSTCPSSRSRCFFATELRPRFQRRPRGPLRHARGVHARCSRAAAPGAARRRGLPVLSVLTRGRRRHRRSCSPDARIIAILREPASFLRSLHLQLLQNHVETEKRPAPRARARAGAAPRRRIPRRSPRPQALLYSEHVRYVEQLRRYQRAVRARADAGADLRGLPRDNEATVRRVLRFLGGRRHGADRGRRGQPDGARALAAARRGSCTRSSLGRGPVARAREGAVKALAPRPACAAARCDAVQRAASSTARRAPPDEELMLELRRRFSGGGGGAQRVPGARPREPVGL